MRVLFVDDDPHVLAGLRRMLRPRAREWELLFASGGSEALATADEVTLDVVVTDMRMPDMDGATLLGHMRVRHPDTVRIVLSGHSERGMSLRSAHVAHQFLSKPCDPDELKTAVERACALRDRLGSPALRRLVGDLDTLPSPPQVVTELNALLESEEPSLDAVSDLVATDPALAAKLLQLVNSSFFGLAQRVTSVRAAVGYLGLHILRNLAVAITAPAVYGGEGVGRRFVDAEQAHALKVSSIARDLVSDVSTAHDAFVAGLLHDVGNLVLARGLPGAFNEVGRLATSEGLTRIEAERAALGTTHAEIGAYLLSLWGLPTSILEAVALHHDAPLLPHRTLDVVHITHVANVLAEADRVDARLGGQLEPGLDPAYLSELGIDVDGLLGLTVG